MPSIRCLALLLAAVTGPAFAQAQPQPRVVDPYAPASTSRATAAAASAPAPGAMPGDAEGAPARPYRPPAGVPSPTSSPTPAYYRAGLDVFATRVRSHGEAEDRLSHVGGGLRAFGAVTPNVFLEGEYQYTLFPSQPATGEDARIGNGMVSDILQQFRAGAGAITPLGASGPLLGSGPVSPPPSVWGRAEFASISILTDTFVETGSGVHDVSARGVGVHGGARLPLGPFVALYGEGGYLFLRDFNDGQRRVTGPEYLGGVEAAPVPTPGGARYRLFAEVRYTGTELRDSPRRNPGLGLHTFRAGVRFGFGSFGPGR